MTTLDAAVERLSKLPPSPWNTDGPVIVWLDCGYEGWQPKSYATVKEALSQPHYNSFIITRKIDCDIVEK